jgi:hypothetical protein
MPLNHEFYVGCIFEDCAFHPVLCTAIEDGLDGDAELLGISLIDGTGPRSCSVLHCGPEILLLEQVVAIRDDFAAYRQLRRAEIEATRASAAFPGSEVL